MKGKLLGKLLIIALLVGYSIYSKGCNRSDEKKEERLTKMTPELLEQYGSDPEKMDSLNILIRMNQIQEQNEHDQLKSDLKEKGKGLLEILAD